MLAAPQWKIDTQERRSALFVAATRVKETMDHVVEGAWNTSEAENNHS